MSKQVNTHTSGNRYHNIDCMTLKSMYSVRCLCLFNFTGYRS